MAILASSSTMFARVLIIVGILQISLLPTLLGSLGAMTLVGYGIVLAMYLKAGSAPPDGAYVEHRNPFELTSALTFGLLYVAVLFIAKAAKTYLGDQGLYASSILAGTTDVDAITLSIIQFYSEGLSSWIAAAAITLAAMTNTLVKTMLAAWLGGWDLARQVAPGMLLILMVGGIVVLVLG